MSRRNRAGRWHRVFVVWFGAAGRLTAGWTPLKHRTKDVARFLAKRLGVHEWWPLP